MCMTGGANSVPTRITQSHSHHTQNSPPQGLLKAEEAKILSEMCRTISKHRQEIKAGASAVAEVDVYRAKAMIGAKLKGIIPEVVNRVQWCAVEWNIMWSSTANELSGCTSGLVVGCHIDAKISTHSCTTYFSFLSCRILISYAVNVKYSLLN